MQRRPLGNSGLEVSVLGLGCGQLGDERMEEAQAERLVHAAVALGITLFDSARSYGVSEERLGRHLGARRQHVVLSTKVGYGIDGFADWTGPCVAAGIDAALSRLRTDCLDVVHLHSCDLPTLRRDDILSALAEARRAGKVRVIGYAGDNEPLEWAIASGHFGAVECSVNVCDQSALGSHADEARRRGLGVIAKRAAANGAWNAAPSNTPPLYLERFQRLGLEAGSLETALRFSAFAPGVDCALVGTSQVAHLEDNVRTIGKGPLEPAVMQGLREAFLHHGTGWRAQI